MVAFGIWLCFPASASVVTPNGPKAMKDLNIGDTVRVVTPEGHMEWSQTCGWLHKMPTEVAEYIQLNTSHRRLVVSDSHLVGVVKNGVIEFVPAADITPGTTLLECDTNPAAAGQAQGKTTPVWGNVVQSVGRVQSVGVYAPLTVAGTIVVDGVAASCYAATKSHRAAHVAMKPMRSMWKHNPDRMKAEPHVGTHIQGAHRYVDFLGRVKMATSRQA